MVTVIDNKNYPAPSTRIRVPKTSEIVADKFREQIIRGELQEGDFLPPEGQLMTALGISRPTIREAFRILEAENLISVVRGSRSGARVLEPSAALVSRYAGYVLQFQKTNVSDLYQARLAIEPYVVRILCTRPPKGALAKLKAELDRLRLLIENKRYTDFIHGTPLFHQTLVECSGNKTLTFLNQLMLDLISRHQRDVTQRRFFSQEMHIKSLKLGLKSYTKLYELIEAKNEQEAVDHWKLHHNNAANIWASKEEASRIVDSLSQY